jgi:hypothetical protein
MRNYEAYKISAALNILDTYEIVHVSAETDCLVVQLADDETVTEEDVAMLGKLGIFNQTVSTCWEISV